MNRLRALIARAAAQPVIFNAVRRVLEADFVLEKRVICEVLGAPAPGRRVLDLGCGTGYFAPLFDPQGYVGADLSRIFIAHAGRTHPGYRFCVEDARRLSFCDRVFDAALVLGMLHHLSDADAAAAMSEVSRVLRPGGRALVLEDVEHDTRAPEHDHRYGALSHVGMRLFRWADVGDYIRSGPGYVALFCDGLQLERTFTAHSGVCFYQGYVLTHEP